jgi:7-carboxy-7-deazaguanine synthase
VTASVRAAALKISEIFLSLQGESSRVGLPTVFVRLTGCPLRCVWCDTAYAFSGGQTMSLPAIWPKSPTTKSRMSASPAVSRWRSRRVFAC